MAIRPATTNTQELIHLALDAAADLAAERWDCQRIDPNWIRATVPDAVAVLESILHIDAPNAAACIAIRTLEFIQAREGIV